MARHKLTLFGLLAALALSAAPAHAAGSDRPCPDWGMYGSGLSRTFSNDCPTRISPQTAWRLRPAWFYKTKRAVTASPVVAGNQLFVGDWSATMYALDKRNGGRFWSHKVAAANGATFGPIVSSAAVADVGSRRLVIFGAGPRLYALDAATGSEVWVSDFGNGVADTPIEIESSPLVHDGRVYVGVDPHNHPPAETGGVRGGLLVLDAATGALDWSFDPELGGPGAGCGGVWSSPTLDAARDLVFIATANCPAAVPWTPHVEAVTALDATPESGHAEVVWSFQPHPPNRADHDFGATPNLFTAAGGVPTLGVGNKDGKYYALNPATGALRWATKVAEPGDFGEDFAVGGFLGSSAVWNGRVFGATAIGGAPWYHALDGASGAIAWRGLAGPGYAGSAAANGVVFHAALDTLFKAFDARTGRLLWLAPLLAPGASAPAVSGDSVFVGSGLASSDLCAKGMPGDALCIALFEDVIGALGGVHAYKLP